MKDKTATLTNNFMSSSGEISHIIYSFLMV